MVRARAARLSAPAVLVAVPAVLTAGPVRADEPPRGPGVVGGNGSQWVIVVPPSVPSQTLYRASIETVGPGGVVSLRADFNPVAVQRPPSTTGGTPATSGTPSTQVGASPAG